MAASHEASALTSALSQGKRGSFEAIASLP